MCESREAEVELAEAAFGSSFQLVSRSEHETTFSIHTTFGVVLTFTIPSDFPRLPLRCLVNGGISNARRESISQSIHQLLEDCPDLGESLIVCSLTVNIVGVLSVHQTVQDQLEFEITTQVNHEVSPETCPPSMRIARFLIYFHHIMWSSHVTLRG